MKHLFSCYIFALGQEVSKSGQLLERRHPKPRDGSQHHFADYEKNEAMYKEKQMRTGEKIYAAVVAAWLPMDHLFSFFKFSVDLFPLGCIRYANITPSNLWNKPHN